MVYYSFSASGTLPSGNRVRAQGYVQAEPNYPHRAFEKAREVVEKQFPGIVLKGDKDGVKTYPTLRQLKKAPAFLVGKTPSPILETTVGAAFKPTTVKNFDDIPVGGSGSGKSYLINQVLDQPTKPTA